MVLWYVREYLKKICYVCTEQCMDLAFNIIPKSALTKLKIVFVSIVYRNL